VELVLQKEHLTLLGLKKILKLKASLNKGLPRELEKAFPNTIPAPRPIVQLPENLDINWFIGFIFFILIKKTEGDGEGSFGVSIFQDKTKIGYSVKITFKLTQHIRDVALFKFIQGWLGCGLIYESPKNSRVDFVITKFQDLTDILIPKLNKYPLQGVKKLNFEDFKLVAELMKNKEHLSLDGLNKIRKIKSGMNTGRIIVNENNINNNNSLISHLGRQKPSLISSINKIVGSALQKRSFHTRVKGIDRIGPHNKDTLEVIIGSLLGIGKANRRQDGTRPRHGRCIIHKDYLFWLYDFYNSRGYCSNIQPRMYTRSVKTKKHFGFEFNTFTFASFDWIHDLFYDKQGTKYINKEIEKYLTPLALAIWISSKPKGYDEFKLYTLFHRQKDIYKLIIMLENSYGLSCYCFIYNKPYYGIGIAYSSRAYFR
jgi:hypothetical protein